MAQIGNRAARGSQKSLQILVNDYPDRLAAAFREKANLPADVVIDWVSPLDADNNAEYRDSAFLKHLGISLSDMSVRSLPSFWPKQGPQWDGLGKSKQGHLILIEAKSHIAEIASPGTSAVSESSITLIQSSLQEAKNYFAPSSQTDWSHTFYQYTNRLAHLYLLRQLNHLPAYLVNIYFVHDGDMGGPESQEEWEGALKLLKVYLGIRETPLQKYVIDLFFSNRTMSPVLTDDVFDATVGGDEEDE